MFHCPRLPLHSTCYQKKLQKHLKVCNAREKERPPYYVRDINAGDGAADPGGPTIYQLSDEALLQLLDKITALYDGETLRPASANAADVRSRHLGTADSIMAQIKKNI